MRWLKTFVHLSCLLAFFGRSYAKDIQYLPSELSLDYTAALRAANEPSLFKQPSEQADSREYRFVWLRTFHKPVVIRLYQHGGGAEIRVVRLSGKGGYEMGQVDYDRVKSVTPAAWQHFADLLAKARFFDLVSQEKGLEPEFDGARWLLEGRTGTTYKFVERVSPRSDSGSKSFAACCEYLLELSALDVPANEIY
jgi:hypothetical protein